MITVWHVGGEDVHMRIALLERLRARGFGIGAVGNGCASRFAGTGIDYHEVPLARGMSAPGDLRTLRALVSLFHRHGPDIVHGFDTKPSLFAPVAARLSGSALAVRTINGMGSLFSDDTPMMRLLRPGYHLAQRLVKDSAAHVVFQNTDDLAYFSEHRLTSPLRSSLIRGSGIDPFALERGADAAAVAAFRTEFSLSDRAPVVTLVARLVRTKGVPEFLAAARAVRSAGIDASFLLVGPLDGEGAGAVRRSTLDEHADVVTATGRRSDIPTVLAATDLFVLPSAYREGVPRALLEAAACGLPLVATDMPGCRDVVRDGGNGRLVAPHDPVQLAETIVEMLSDLPRWQVRARAARADIESRFGLERVAEEHAALYSRLMHASRGS